MLKRWGRGPGANLTLLMALPLWNQRLGTRFGPRFLTRCGRTGYSGRILMALGKHDVLPVRWELMNRFFAVIYSPLVSYFHQTSADGLSSVKAWSQFQTREFVSFELNFVCNSSPIGWAACDKFSLQICIYTIVYCNIILLYIILYIILNIIYCILYWILYIIYYIAILYIV